MNNSFAAQIFPIMPEIFIAALAMVILIAGVLRSDKHAPFIAKASAGVLVLSAILLSQLWGADFEALNGMFISDGFSVFVKTIIVLSAACILIISLEYLKSSKGRFEHSILILLSVVGMMIMVSSNDLITLYMGLELQSLCLYVLATIDRDSVRSSEAGMKYFVLGALASGMLLYGASLVYGFAGTTNFEALAGIYQASSQEELSIGLLVGIIFVITGLCFKVSAVPFHMWTPDVYEGAPTPVTAFFATAPKVAALAMFIRVMEQPFGNFEADWQQIIIFVSAASMIVGAIGALKQTNIKRLMAYSSIGHVGYMLVGLAAGAVLGVQAMLLYMAIYVIMSIGVFTCIIKFKKRGESVEKISDFAGLAKTNPVFAAVIAILMFSMAGIPPLAGFFGKLFIFKAAVESGLYALAIIGVLTSVIAAFYYLRIVKLMYFDDSEEEIDGEFSPEIKWVLAGSTAFNLLYIISPVSLLNFSKIAASTLFL